MNIDRKKLELFLEKTPDYVSPKEYLEQYITPSNVASKILWEAFIRGDIEGKTILDLGCGTLRLGIGALFLGAHRIIGIDIDYDVLAYTYKWLCSNGLLYKALLVLGDVRDTHFYNIDTIIMNPPFGVKKRNRGIDMIFLSKALSLGNSVYTMHKYSSGARRLIREIAKAFNSRIVHEEIIEFPIKMIYKHHRRRIYRIKVDLYGIKRCSGHE
ncbi:MAG: methyltransferase [Thermoprotei archaeon]|nr:MAG: methyltransferase [Thermoprotei archaeon]